MHRLLMLFLVVIVLGAACGDDDAKTTAAPTTTEAAATTEAPTTTEAPPVTEEVTTTADPAAAMVALAGMLVGDYTGEWENTTFTSNGPIDAEISVDADTATLTLTVDLGGYVFGAGDPPAETFGFNLTAGPPLTGTSVVVGDFILDVTMAGSFELIADAVPDPTGRVTTITVRGTVGFDGSVEGDYVVGFSDGTSAEGTISVAPA